MDHKEVLTVVETSGCGRSALDRCNAIDSILRIRENMPIRKLLFIDTNIWLDFYRVRNEIGLGLLAHTEAISDRIIITFQLESEFKKNRQSAILEGLKELKNLNEISRPGIFSDAKAVKVINKSVKGANRRIAGLKLRLTRALENPALHDNVYKACQRIFHKQDELTLTREDKTRHAIRRKAFRRFLHGCPPRKPNDTSIGDAFNWEWMVRCANNSNAELVIVSRDQDYGSEFEKTVYVNDHLKQEFSERVSKKRKLLLYTRLAEALKHFQISVTPQQEEAEAEIVETMPEEHGELPVGQVSPEVMATLDKLFRPSQHPQEGRYRRIETPWLAAARHLTS